jgi:hypothetical protein
MDVALVAIARARVLPSWTIVSTDASPIRRRTFRGGDVCVPCIVKSGSIETATHACD